MRKLAIVLLLFSSAAGASNEGVTRHGISGMSAIPYGSFTGKVAASPEADPAKKRPKITIGVSIGI